jgi:hypothetical protein
VKWDDGRSESLRLELIASGSCATVEKHVAPLPSTVQESADRADKVGRMPVWTWIVIGATTVLVLSIVAGLAVSAILGSISRDLTELIEIDLYASAALKRVKTPTARA